jgi:hypothetical protein
MSTLRLQADSQHVVHEAIDGETLVVQLTTGAYYSLRGTAHEAWEMLVAQHPVQAVAAELSRRYPDPAGVEDDVARYAAELLAEELLVELDGAVLEDAAAPPPPTVAALPDYAPPRLERYTDMQYFLLLDPIHEVDDVAGWPQPAASSEVAG